MILSSITSKLGGKPAESYKITLESFQNDIPALTESISIWNSILNSHYGSKIYLTRLIIEHRIHILAWIHNKFQDNFNKF